MTTWTELIPERMRGNGKPVNNSFSPGEKLYHRINRAMLGEVRPGLPVGFIVQFRIPDMSANRTEPDGEPGDVLLVEFPKYKDCGIISFAVSDIPCRHCRDVGKPIHFRVEHDPEDYNYYHSEIRAFHDDGKRLKDVKKATSTWFRLELSGRLTRESIVREPQV